VALSWKREANGVLVASPAADIMVTVYPLPAGLPVSAETKRWETCVRWHYAPAPYGFANYDSEQDAIDDAPRLTAAALDALVVQLAEAREEVTR